MGWLRKTLARFLLIARQEWLALVGGIGFVSFIISTFYFAPEPPGVSDFWRWSAIVVALGLSGWNVWSASRAYKPSGFLSIAGFLHAWLFFAFSFPAFEMTYRYSVIKVGQWEASTNTPLLLGAVLVVGVFQLLFFLALGREPHDAINRVALASRAERPNRRIALIFFLLAVPLLVAKLSVVLDLGLYGVVETMITRKPYNEMMSYEQSDIAWLLTTLFPVYAVGLLCLGNKYVVKHPSFVGSSLYSAALLVSGMGVAISGVRSQLVLVLFIVLLFMYVQGYRKLIQYAPVVPAVLILALTIFLVGQARHGVENQLSTIVGINDTGPVADVPASAPPKAEEPPSPASPPPKAEEPPSAGPPKAGETPASAPPKAEEPPSLASPPPKAEEPPPAGPPKGGVYVGYDYAKGDITQLFGLGRFDAVTMIVDRSGDTPLLWGKSYVYAVVAGLNATLLPKIILGYWFQPWRISDQVMGYWIFGEAKASALPSASGELLLNFGFVGVALGAIVLGFAVRLLLLWMLKFNGAVEFAWAMTIWVIARFLSDESFLMAPYVVMNWLPVILLTFLLVRRGSGRSYPAEAFIKGVLSRARFTKAAPDENPKDRQSRPFYGRGSQRGE